MKHAISIITCSLVISTSMITFLNLSHIAAQGGTGYRETLRIGIGQIESAVWSPTQDRIAVATDTGISLYTSAWQLIKFAPLGGLVSTPRKASVTWSNDGNWIALTRDIEALNEAVIEPASDSKETIILDANLNPTGTKFQYATNSELIWSPDSTRLAATWRNGFKIWDRSGQLLLAAPTGEPNYQAFTTLIAWFPDSSRIITAPEIQTLQVWNATTGVLLGQYTPASENEQIFSIALSPDGTKIAVGTWSGLIQIRTSDTFQLLSTLHGHTQFVYKLAWKGTRLFTAAMDNVAYIWDTASLTKLTTISLLDTVRFLSFNLDLSQFMINSADTFVDTIALYNTQTGQKLSQLRNQLSPPRVVAAWTPDGLRVVTSDRGKPFQFYSATTGTLAQEITSTLSNSVMIVWSPDGTKLATINSATSIIIWQVAGNAITVVNTIPTGESDVGGIGWNPDGTQLAGIDSKGIVKIWDVTSGNLVVSFQANRNGGQQIAWNADGTRLAVDENVFPSVVTVWDTSTWTLVKSIGYTGTYFGWSPDGTKIVVGGETRPEIYNATNLGLVSTLVVPPNDTVGQLTWNPDGRYIAGGGLGGSILLWDTTAPAVQPIYISGPVNYSSIYTLQWSPNGTQLMAVYAAQIRVFTRSDLITPTPTLTPTLTPTPRPDSPAIYRPTTSTFHFSTLPSVTFGNPNDHPITGDWDGDGIDTVGVFDPLAGRFQLRNSNTAGPPDLSFLYGNPGDIPLAGHWTAAALHDGVGTYRNTNGTMYLFLRNQLSTGYADLTAIVGNPGDLPIVGDWNGDGVDTVGLYRPESTTFYLFNRNAPDMEVETQFTLSGGVPIAGRWTGSGGAGVGFFADGVFSLKDTLESGTFDRTVVFGESGDVPLAGRWSP